jgi:hypothetical protein
MRCTEWRPRHAAWQFGSCGGAAIGELIVRPQMSIPQRTQRIVIGTFGVILTYPGLQMLFDSAFPWWIRLIGLGLAAVVAAPSIAFVCGVRWCRCIVGVLSILFLTFWSLSPLMQHAIDRHAGFWFIWTMIEIFLIMTSVAAFTRTAEASDAA